MADETKDNKSEREAMMSNILVQFHRFINRKNESDNRALLLLIAALSALNSDVSDSKAIATSRRLVQLAMTRGRSIR